jgi:hypothetical protein
MRMILYLLIALIPIAIVYSRYLDGSKLKDFFLAVSYLSVMAWALFFALTIPFLPTPAFSSIIDDANA